MAESKRVAAIVGVGPGLGAALAHRFAREGFAVALMARSLEGLEVIGNEIEQAGGQALPVTVDASDPASVEQAFARVSEALASPEVFIYNAGSFVVGGLLELEPETFENAWKINCFGAFLAAQQVLPAMLERGRGTILFTGATAATRAGARFAGFAVGKFGLRALSQSLAREFGPRGIHVAHVIVDGQIDTPRARSSTPERDRATMLAPEAIAMNYWHLHCQDVTTWTHELDLRPAVEKW